MARMLPAIQRELNDANVRLERQQRERELEAIALDQRDHALGKLPRRNAAPAP